MEKTISQQDYLGFDKYEYGPLLASYASLLLLGFRRCHSTISDFRSLKFAILAPFLYLAGFKGELETPIGRLLVTDREVLRSFTYGFFKTHITYRHYMATFASSKDSHLYFPIVVDIGANLGDFTLTVKKFAGKIIAIEPGEDNYQALKANIKINKMLNVIPLRVAAHSQVEDLFLNGQSSNLFVSVDETDRSVLGLPVDLVLENQGISIVDLMKVDVQGHERSVLEGMKGLLSKRKVKFLIIEVHLKRDVTVKDILNFMKDYDYTLVNKDDFLYDQPHLYFAAN